MSRTFFFVHLFFFSNDKNYSNSLLKMQNIYNNLLFIINYVNLNYL